MNTASAVPSSATGSECSCTPRTVISTGSRASRTRAGYVSWSARAYGANASRARSGKEIQSVFQVTAAVLRGVGEMKQIRWDPR